MKLALLVLVSTAIAVAFVAFVVLLAAVSGTLAGAAGGLS